MDNKTKKIVIAVVGVVVLLLVVFGLTKAFSNSNDSSKNSSKNGDERITAKSNHAVTGKVQPKRSSSVK